MHLPSSTSASPEQSVAMEESLDVVVAVDIGMTATGKSCPAQP